MNDLRPGRFHGQSLWLYLFVGKASEPQDIRRFDTEVCEKPGDPPSEV